MRKEFIKDLISILSTDNVEVEFQYLESLLDSIGEMKLTEISKNAIKLYGETSYIVKPKIKNIEITLKEAMKERFIYGKRFITPDAPNPRKAIIVEGDFERTTDLLGLVLGLPSLLCWDLQDVMKLLRKGRVYHQEFLWPQVSKE